MIYYQLCDEADCSLTQCLLENAQSEEGCLDSIIDQEGNCENSNQCGVIEISVKQVNDVPVLSCTDCNLSLVNNDYLELNQLYEDCNTEESGSNENCNDMDGISVNNLRLNKDYEDEPCSAQHLWIDPDCLDLHENFGIAIDLNALDDNDDKGKWQYTVDGDFIDIGILEISPCCTHTKSRRAIFLCYFSLFFYFFY